MYVVFAVAVVVAVAAAAAAAVCLDFSLDCRESSDDVACRWVVVVVLDLANSSFPKAILVLVCRAMVERAMFRERT